MDDEFKLCWKNFQDNIASGFQNLYDRGDLVDVTLACDGKLLQAHKIVLAICSPYFQEIFTTNPCQHPIIILKDVSFNIMCELLEFMYQGVVNVKHTELQSFMKIGQLLQIKGLATNASASPHGSSNSEKSTSQAQNASEEQQGGSGSVNNNSNNNNHSAGAGKMETDQSEVQPSSKTSTHSNSLSRTSTASPGGNIFYSKPVDPQQLYTLSKRHAEFSNDSLSIYSRKQLRRSLTDHAAPSGSGSLGEGSENADTSLEMSSDEFFLPPIPHISMIEPRYDLGGVKRESEHHGGASSSSSSAAAAAVAALRNPFGSGYNFDYNLYKSSNSSGGGAAGSSHGNNNNNNNGGPVGVGANAGAEYPNELYMPNDYSKNFGNHMDIPPIAPGEHWFQGKLEFMLSQRGKPLLVHAGHTFGIQYVRKDKKYWQCNLSRKFNCKARVTTTDTGEIIVTNNEHCHTEIRQHLRKDYQRNKVMMNALINLSTNRFSDLRRHNLAGLGGLSMPAALTQNSPIDEVVQNLHDLARASKEADEANHQQQQQQQQQQLEQRAHDQALTALKQDNEEPLDCGLRSSISDYARSFMVNNATIKALSDSSSNQPQDELKCKNEGTD